MNDEPAGSTPPPAAPSNPSYSGYRRLTIRQRLFPNDDVWPFILKVRTWLLWVLVATIIWRFREPIQSTVVAAAQWIAAEYLSNGTP